MRSARNAGRTGTSQRPNLKRRGCEGRKELFYPYGKNVALKLSANRIERGARRTLPQKTPSVSYQKANPQAAPFFDLHEEP